MLRRRAHLQSAAFTVAWRASSNGNSQFITRGQRFGIFQQQYSLARAGVACSARQPRHHKGGRKHPGGQRVGRLRFCLGHGGKQQGREAQAAFAKARSLRQVFKPQRRALAAKGKVAPCAAALTAQQRAICLMRTGGKGSQPAVNGKLAQAHDGGAAKACAGFHKQQGRPNRGRASRIRMVKERRQGFKEAVKPIFAAAFGLFTIGLARSGIAVNIHVLGIQRIKFVLVFYGACAARTLFAKTQLVEHVGGADQPRTRPPARKQRGGLPHDLIKRRTGHAHGPYGLARQLAQNFHKGFAQLKRLRRGIQSQYPHWGAAPFRPCQPEGQWQGQRAGTHVHQQGLATLRSHRAGVGQGQACQQARETHKIPGQKIIQIGADGGRGTPVRTRQPCTFCGQKTRKLGHVVGQRALVPRIERPYLGQGFGQHIQNTLCFSRKRWEQRSGGRPSPQFKRTHGGALILALKAALPGASKISVALSLLRPKCRPAVAISGCVGRTSILTAIVTAICGAVSRTPVVTAIFAVVFLPTIAPCITAVILPP